MGNSLMVIKFSKFIIERHNIYLRREAGKPKPWTSDLILQSYRFCNAYRELDKVTIWIRANWRAPHADDPDIWFTMAVARLINWPESLAAGGYPVPWKPGKWRKALNARKSVGEKVFTGAYMIRGVEANGASKVDYLAEQVLTPLWEARKQGRIAFSNSLHTAHNWLLQFYGIGSFLAAQVIADVKYTPLLSNASDWWTWAAPGPGSLRGMSRVEFGDLGTRYSNAAWYASLVELQRNIDPLIARAGLPRMHAQDLQNCLCEFDKYERVRLGQGRPRARYNGISD